MFSRSKKKEAKKAQLEAASVKRNILTEGTIVVGNIKSDGDFRIDGVLEGDLEIDGKIVVGPSGKIIGNVTCDNADVEGVLSGIIKVKGLMTVKQAAKISGEVTTGKIAIETGATLHAACTMKEGDNIINEGSKAKKKKSVQ